MDKEYIKEKNEQIKKENKKLIPIFVVVLIFLYVAGYFTGRTIKRLEMRGFMESLKNSTYTILTYSLPVIYIILILLLAAVGIPQLVKLIKKTKAWDGEDEDYIANVEKSLDALVNYSTVVSILSFGLFSMNVILLEKNGSLYNIKNLYVIINIACLVCELIFTMLIQVKALKYIKLINPEKRGNLFSFDFNKEWIESCDEAQKFAMYKASFKAHRTVNNTCLILWIFTLICGLGFKTGIMPIACVSIIWLVDIIVYIREESRLEK